MQPAFCIFYRIAIWRNYISFALIEVFPQLERLTTILKLDDQWEITFQHITHDEKACILVHEYFIEQSACE